MGLVNYFLGFEVERTTDGLHLHQSKYALELLQHTNMVSAKPCRTPTCVSHKLSLGDNPPFTIALLELFST